MRDDLRRTLSSGRAAIVEEPDLRPASTLLFDPARTRAVNDDELQLILDDVVIDRGAQPAVLEFSGVPDLRVALAGSLAGAAPPYEAPIVGAPAPDDLPKRALDVVIAALAILALAPLLACICVLIRIDGPGPALFRQRRCGMNGRQFQILKFRTMTVCDDSDAVVQTLRRDARITRIGGFLRRTSLDELPQLFNVLSGDMSLVGPRPHAMCHDAAFAESIPSYARRYEVRPGITGLAQVRGHRGAIWTREQLVARVASDLEYIDRRSLLVDLRILLASTVVVFRPSGS